MTLFRILRFPHSSLFLDEIRIVLRRYLGGVEQYVLAVQSGASLLDMKLYMNGVFHCFEDEQTYVLGPHRPVELEDDLMLHDLKENQREMIVLVHPAPVEHIPLALQHQRSDSLVCLVLENLTDAQLEHLPSWLTHEAGHISCLKVSATHVHVNTILSMIRKALPSMPLLQSIDLRRTAYAPSGVERDALMKLCQATKCYQITIHLDAHVFHNEKRMFGHQLLRSYERPYLPRILMSS